MSAYDLTARRRYSREEKAAIVAESLREGAVSAVARRHRVAPAQLFRWKKEFAAAEAKEAAAPVEAAGSAKFVLAVVAPASRARRRRPDLPCAGSREEARCAVEIAFPNGCVLRVPGDLGEAALSRLVRALTA
jgi:transposase